MEVFVINNPAIIIGIAVGLLLVSAIVFFRLGVAYRKKFAESSIKSAEEEAKRIVISYKKIH